ncbi:hypothetical protein LSTR_LSTR009596 [Laodelphax striatellus]|uniref:Uncharacterized protein n=1 Tax=Laodelphax striatellus TaxID=195883 RepID=A0A482WQJ5_LAOST|nr:hypothetical protein LSTR_LSTR009596 [Laodelphax striatellus]
MGWSASSRVVEDANLINNEGASNSDEENNLLQDQQSINVVCQPSEKKVDKAFTPSASMSVDMESCQTQASPVPALLPAMRWKSLVLGK